MIDGLEVSISDDNVYSYIKQIVKWEEWRVLKLVIAMLIKEMGLSYTWCNSLEDSYTFYLSYLSAAVHTDSEPLTHYYKYSY